MKALDARLRERGVDCHVESRDRLAILVPNAPLALGAEDRQAVIRLAKEGGFTHVALELDPDGAGFPRD